MLVGNRNTLPSAPGNSISALALTAEPLIYGYIWLEIARYKTIAPSTANLIAVKFNRG